MSNIRTVLKSDIERIEFICKETAGEKARVDFDFGEAIAKTYATYYVSEEAENCLALISESDEIVGYVLCSTDIKKFSRAYRTRYSGIVFKHNKAFGILAFFIPVPYLVLKNKYPAHLHIDLLEEYQGKGYGTRLIEKLCENLKGSGVKGLMLMVDSKNTGAIKFYERLGFRKVIKLFGGIAMAKEI